MEPINFKFKKTHKVRVKETEKEFKRFKLQYGVYGLQTMSGYRLTAKQIESVRRTIKKCIKKEGEIWFKVSLNRFLTSKPAEVRMGKGKGHLSTAVTVVKSGTIIVEVGGEVMSSKKALASLKLAAQKLPLKVNVCKYFV